MEILILILQLAILAGIVVAGLLLRHYLPGYADQKGKNLATKEDIAVITREIEGVRTKFHAIQFATQTRYAKLHERRADALDQLYKKLWRTQRAFLPVTGGFHQGEGLTSEQLVADAAAAGTDLMNFYTERRLYIPEDVRNSVDSLNSDLINAWNTFSFDRREDVRDAPPEEKRRHLDAWKPPERLCESASRRSSTRLS